MKTKIKLRLILSVLMLCMTAVTLTTSTFAWFATNRNAWLDEIELEIGNADNLLVSVDGSSFRSSIPSDMVKRAVIAKKKNISYNDQTLNDKNYVNTEFKKITMEPITTSDLVTFKGVDKKFTQQGVDGKKYFLLQDVNESESYSYLQFDVWFTVESSKSATKNYDLKFVTDRYIAQEANAGNDIKASYIKGDESEVLLYNDMITQGTEDKRTGNRSDGTAYEKGKYVSGDTIKVNCQDAMRVGLTRLEQKGHDDNQKFIFEPNEGLGSYALKDYLNTTNADATKFDPNKNAMYTYFNNLNEAQLAPLEMTSFDFVNNVYRNNLKDDISLGEIVPNETLTSYTALKYTVTIWLEGYDADYVIGMYNTSLKMYLNFCIEEKE